MAYLINKEKRIHLESSTGEIDNSFVGLKIFGDDIYIHYPECYPLSIEDQSFPEDVLSLLGTFSLMDSSYSDDSIVAKGENQGDFRLDSFLWIIRDYMNYGFYKNREKEYKLNLKGKINWKRTLDLEPVVSGDNVVYTDFIVEKKSVVDDIIVEIHKYCVKKSLDFIGWLFNLDGDFIETNRVTEDRKKYYLYVLREELYSTFDDHKKDLFRNMIHVIEGISDYDTKNIISYGVDQYYSIFEKMIDKIFGNVDIKKFYPKGKWELVNKEPIDSSSLRPDTVLQADDIIYIIDSKYYRYGFSGDPNDLPETTSIQKQIAYGQFAQKTNKSSVIYNVFVMPYNSVKNKLDLQDKMEYIGKAYSESTKLNKTYHYVYSFLMDLKHVIKTYNKFNHEVDIECLVNTIQKMQDKHLGELI